LQAESDFLMAANKVAQPIVAGDSRESAQLQGSLGMDFMLDALRKGDRR
jgi:hypothetical protein